MRFLVYVAAMFAALSLITPTPAFAQPAYAMPDLATQRAAMERLSGLVGDWQGEVSVQFPQPMTVHQSERVERDLDGLVLVIHGTGHATAARSGAPVFQAMAVISYNDRRGGYDVRSYTHEGHVATASGEFLDDGHFRWTIDAGGPMRMRFTMAFDETSWREIGEFSRDAGATWTQTLEMSLSRGG